MGFDSSLINFTCPHFCPWLFIGPIMKTLTYFLITDYFPWRLVGSDALLSNPEAINDYCTPQLKFGYSEWPKSCGTGVFLPPLLSMPFYSPRETQSLPYFSPIDAVYGERNSDSTLQLCSFLCSAGFHPQKVCFINLRRHYWRCPEVTQIKNKKWDDYLQYLCVWERKLRDRDQERDRMTQSGWKESEGERLASHLWKINCGGWTMIKGVSCSVKWCQIETTIQGFVAAGAVIFI